MENKDKSEQLLDLLLDLTDGAAIGLAYTDGPGKAYQLAGEVVCELEEAKARIKEMEHVAATVAVDAGALDELRAELSKLDVLKERLGRGESVHSMPLAWLNVENAARRLLAVGE